MKPPKKLEGCGPKYMPSHKADRTRYVHAHAVDGTRYMHAHAVDGTRHMHAHAVNGTHIPAHTYIVFNHTQWIEQVMCMHTQ